MKVFIVLEFNGSSTNIIGVYPTESGATRRRARLIQENISKSRLDVTTGIIKKTVKGLGGIKFEMDGKSRYITNVGGK
jgi:hypothetical protein